MQENHISIVESRLSTKVTGCVQLQGGISNRVYRLEAQGYPDLIAKEYYPDDRRRIDREYSALDFFNRHSPGNTPVPYFREGNKFAIYSFEQSVDRQPEDVTTGDAHQVSGFVNSMYSFPPASTSGQFDDAVMASFSLEDFLKGTKFRVGKFMQHVQQGAVHADVRNLHDSYNVSGLTDRIEERVRKMSGNIYERPLDLDMKRLSPTDFGVHNMLFRPTGDICFIDFEFFGWDDPMKLVSNFYHHEKNSGLSQEVRRSFIRDFVSSSTLPAEMLGRLDSYMLLSAAEWIGVMLWSITPEKIAIRQFANPQFDVESYRRKAVGKLSQRLRDIDEDLHQA